jgi:hypothetical protein
MGKCPVCSSQNPESNRYCGSCSMSLPPLAAAALAWQFNRPKQGDAMVLAFRRPDSSNEETQINIGY